MFSLFSGLYSEYFSPQQINLLVVGVQGSGKTTLLERIKVTDFPAKSVLLHQTPPDVDGKPVSPSKTKLGPAPEQLRSKIFASRAKEDYEPPATTRRRRERRDPLTQLPPHSRFAWLCPPPPKYRSQDSRIYASDLHCSDTFDDPDLLLDVDQQPGETESLRSSPTARSRQAVVQQRNVGTALLTVGSSSHHRNAGLAASAPPHGGPAGLPAPRRIAEYATDELRKSSMESIELGPSVSRYSLPVEERAFLDALHHGDEPVTQYDVKAGAKMLPLERIRPTIGMNLAKTEICGAKVHIWDLGGKLQDLWNRYYNDADAVIFVWRLSRDDTQVDDDTDMDDSYRAPVTPEAQKAVLEQVRSAVPDDVPFVILGNLFQPVPPCYCEPDVLYSTQQLLPHYHNPHQAVFLANASSGQGVKMALEWLMTTAKRQKRLRERSTDGALEK